MKEFCEDTNMAFAFTSTINADWLTLTLKELAKRKADYLSGNYQQTPCRIKNLACKK